MAWSVASADTRTLRGQSLSLTLATDEDTSIETDASLVGEIRVLADRTDCLDAEGQYGGELRLSTASCGSDSGHVTIMVPTVFPVTLIVVASGNVHVTDTQGPLKATLSSDADLSIRNAHILQLQVRGSGDTTLDAVSGAADIDISGSGGVKIQHLDGMLKYTQHGSGDLTVGTIQSPAAQLEIAGSGDVSIGGGHIGVLQVRGYGSGDVTVAGSVGVADIQASGGGDIRIPRPATTLNQRASGGSTITIGSDVDGGEDTIREIGRAAHAGGSHILAGIVVLGLMIAAARTLMRHGGLARAPASLRNRFAQPGVPPAPHDPGVVALCDLLAGLERRLAQVEIHVTSREFELNRKFREIDTRAAGGTGT